MTVHPFKASIARKRIFFLGALIAGTLPPFMPGIGLVCADTIPSEASRPTVWCNGSFTFVPTLLCSFFRWWMDCDDVTPLHQIQQQAEEQIPQFIDRMEGFTDEQIWDEILNCDQYFKGNRPIHNESVWMMLRGVYQGIVGPEGSSIQQPLSTEHGFSVDVIVDYSPGKGRGVFANQDIRKGQLVYSEWKQKAQFATGKDFRRFLQSIPEDLACDVLEWAYVENINGKNLTICLDVDEGALLNNGGKRSETNIGCDEEAAKKLNMDCELHDFALRDIRKGEELLCDYADFDEPDGWREFGM